MPDAASGAGPSPIAATASRVRPTTAPPPPSPTRSPTGRKAARPPAAMAAPTTRSPRSTPVGRTSSSATATSSSSRTRSRPSRSAAWSPRTAARSSPPTSIEPRGTATVIRTGSSPSRDAFLLGSRYPGGQPAGHGPRTFAPRPGPNAARYADQIDPVMQQGRVAALAPRGTARRPPTGSSRAEPISGPPPLPCPGTGRTAPGGTSRRRGRPSCPPGRSSRPRTCRPW